MVAVSLLEGEHLLFLILVMVHLSILGQFLVFRLQEKHIDLHRYML